MRLLGSGAALLAAITLLGLGTLACLQYLQQNLPASTLPWAQPSPPRDMRQPLVVVGGGLAGVTAALTAAAQAAHVVLLEKEPRPGGNSMKASSGINALTPQQGDSKEVFQADTLRSGGGRSKPQLVETLVGSSQDALSWLEGQGLNLSSVVQLGGHSRKRTHANPSGPNVGFAIMRTVLERLQQAANVEVVSGTKVTSLMRTSGRVHGVTYTTTDGSTHQQEAGAVVLATGGFGANQLLLQMHAPEAAGLATTNGAFAQGEGLALAQGVGTELVHLDAVQVHPTGFVDPADPSSGTKILAPEKLRGVGGILLDAQGRRFVDELSTRDRVSAAIMALPVHTAHLVLGVGAAAAFGPAMWFYVGKGLAKKVEGAAGLAALLEVEESVVAAELDAYNKAAAGRGADPFGKSVFPGTIDPQQELLVATVTPVVHYTMGGVAINPKAEALDPGGAPIPGLYAAGEVAGGVHGANRLGGNSLLECVVFGRRAGSNAAGYILEQAELAENAAAL